MAEWRQFQLKQRQKRLAKCEKKGKGELKKDTRRNSGTKNEFRGFGETTEVHENRAARICTVLI